MNRLAIIVDASSAVGIGHLSRCMALAAYGQSHRLMDIEFFVELGSQAEGILAHSEFRFNTTPSYDDGDYESYIKTLFEANHFDIVLIDLKEEDLDRHSFLTDISDLLIGSITMFDFKMDRFEHITFYPGLEKSGRSVLQGRNGRQAIQYSGADYFIFRKEFDKDFKKKFRADDNRLLLTMGGADPWGFTELALHGIELIPFPVHCKVLLPRLSTDIPALEQIMIRGSQTYETIEYTSDMAELMASVDVAIINGGITRYELSIVGTPFIAISVHETQFGITEQVARGGASINLGLGSKIDTELIGKTAGELLRAPAVRKSMSRKLKGRFDHLGSHRILELLILTRKNMAIKENKVESND